VDRRPLAKATPEGSPWVDRYARRVLAVGIVAVVAFIVAVLFEAYFHPRGQAFRASSAWSGWDTEGDTSTPRPYGLWVHTRQENRPWFELDLGRVRRISTVRVTNRKDCCQDRAVPLEIAVRASPQEDWRSVGVRNDRFWVWTAELEETEARYVRVTVLRESVLHLQRVEAW
jgi:hypothetical protein